MATVNPEVQSVPAAQEVFAVPPPDLRIYSHSSFFYWWPVWLTGFVLALITRIGGEQVTIGGTEVWMHPSKNLGVFFGVVLFLVILITNVTVRGMASVIVILTFLFLTVLFAYLGWWETILSWMPHLAAYINLGFYLFFSTLLFLVWASAVFIYDHLSYWSFRPGQLTHVQVIGNQEKSYDTRGMTFEKISNDLFRHMILGLGSGDMHLTTAGAHREEILIPNVLFVGRQIKEMQELVATKPDVVSGTHV
jgi:hypothetical protein